MSLVSPRREGGSQVTAHARAKSELTCWVLICDSAHTESVDFPRSEGGGNWEPWGGRRVAPSCWDILLPEGLSQAAALRAHKHLLSCIWALTPQPEVDGHDRLVDFEKTSTGLTPILLKCSFKVNSGKTIWFWKAKADLGILFGP